MKIIVLWDVMPYNFMDKQEHVRGTCWHYLQHEGVSCREGRTGTRAKS
jgi:hypothetical protein